MIKKLLRIIKTPEFAKYLAVGGTAFLVEYSSFFMLYAVLHLWLALSNGVSFVAGLLASFILNRLWSFKHNNEYDKRKSHQFVFYAVLALANLLLTIVLVELFKVWGVNPLYGKILASGITSVWNFVLFKLFIFTHKK